MCGLSSALLRPPCTREPFHYGSLGRGGQLTDAFLRQFEQLARTSVTDRLPVQPRIPP
jgi:hypothetical protein